MECYKLCIVQLSQWLSGRVVIIEMVMSVKSIHALGPVKSNSPWKILSLVGTSAGRWQYCTVAIPQSGPKFFEWTIGIPSVKATKQ